MNANHEGLLGKEERREHRQSRTRLGILDAAATIFQEKGISGARLQDIAAQAGYTVPTLYSYFRSKEAIVEALFEQLSQELLDTFSKLPPKGYTIEQSFDFLMQRVFDFSDRRRGLALLVIEMHDRPEFLCQQRCTRVQELREVIVAWLGHVLNDTPVQWTRDEMASFILGLWHANTSLWLMEMSSGRLLDRAFAISQMAIHGILRGVGSEKSPD
ncbi:MAG: TetR/AcrR family transcriptional regulator [Myxococcales bacterium]|jgi:AcrR family transcriptional regulator|nr:TetR/AcrR family transcriptional regulator [Myxococcales bacterium]